MVITLEQQIQTLKLELKDQSMDKIAVAERLLTARFEEGTSQQIKVREDGTHIRVFYTNPVILFQKDLEGISMIIEIIWGKMYELITLDSSGKELCLEYILGKGFKTVSL